MSIDTMFVLLCLLAFVLSLLAFVGWAVLIRHLILRFDPVHRAARQPDAG